MYFRYPPSLRQGEDILFERAIDICHETVRLWWNRFGPTFAAVIGRRRIHRRLLDGVNPPGESVYRLRSTNARPVDLTMPFSKLIAQIERDHEDVVILVLTCQKGWIIDFCVA